LRASRAIAAALRVGFEAPGANFRAISEHFSAGENNIVRKQQRLISQQERNRCCNLRDAELAPVAYNY
jgi:hypothetical protein